MPRLRFIPDGKVPGVINLPKHRAKCVECLLGQYPERQAKTSGIVSNSGPTDREIEITTGEAPF